MNIRVKDIKEGKKANSFEGEFFVRDVTFKMGVSGPFLSFRIMDKSGAVETVFFGGEINGKFLPRGKIEKSLIDEGVYRIKLRTQEGRKNVIVDSMEKVDLAKEDFIPEPRAEYPKGANIRESMERLAEKSIKSEEGWRLYRIFWEKYEREFLKAKGAVRKHHSEEGGLALHTYMVMRIALYLGHIYGLNLEVLFLASLLHDIGKMEEIGENGFTREGDLLGHTVISIMRAEELCKKAGYDGKSKVNLLHCIASHHGEQEFGAPVSPKTLEAFVLHIADLTDSKIYQYFEAIKEIGEGEESSEYFRDLAKRVYFLDKD